MIVETRDKATVAYYLTLGYKMVDVELRDARRRSSVYVRFESGLSDEKTIDNDMLFRTHKARVDPMAYKDAIDLAADIIHTHLRKIRPDIDVNNKQE